LNRRSIAAKASTPLPPGEDSTPPEWPTESRSSSRASCSIIPQQCHADPFTTPGPARARRVRDSTSAQVPDRGVLVSLSERRECPRSLTLRLAPGYRSPQPFVDGAHADPAARRFRAGLQSSRVRICTSMIGGPSACGATGDAPPPRFGERPCLLEFSTRGRSEHASEHDDVGVSAADLLHDTTAADRNARLDGRYSSIDSSPRADSRSARCAQQWQQDRDSLVNQRG